MISNAYYNKHDKYPKSFLILVITQLLQSIRFKKYSDLCYDLYKIFQEIFN